MAWEWCETFGNYTLFKSSVQISNDNYGDYVDANTITTGDSPLSGLIGGNIGTFDWQITNDFKIYVYKDGSQVYYQIYLEGVLLGTTNDAVDPQTIFNIGFVYDDSRQYAQLICGRQFAPPSGQLLLNSRFSGSQEMATLYPYVKEAMQPPIIAYTSNGGGATHIAKVTGQLKDLSSNLSDILIVSGGGGGGMLVGETEYAGADAGGIAGNSDNSADQTTGYAFGQGESGTDVSGGGGGFYGGYKGVIV